jgi:hypothetical protein
MKPTHAYEVRPRKDKRGVDLVRRFLNAELIRHNSHVQLFKRIPAGNGEK